MNRVRLALPYVIVILAILGALDAAYLTWEHYHYVVPPCSIHWWLSDCGKVLSSKYSVVFGIPLALFGVMQYLSEAVLAVLSFSYKQSWAFKLLILFSTVGAIFSAYFVYLMLGVLGAICWYCMGSAVISVLLFATNSIYNLRSKGD